MNHAHQVVAAYWAAAENRDGAGLPRSRAHLAERY